MAPPARSASDASKRVLVARAPLARVPVESRAEWRRWLARHHAASPGVWLVTWKAGSGRPRVPYDAIVEEALCYGWVDSLPRRLDDARTMLRVTPRKRGSAWSAPNKARVARLTAAGRMAPAGLAAVEAARADGSWGRIDAAQARRVPPDLAAALAAHPEAARHWAAFPPSAHKGILEWILQAKRPETRARRVATTVAEASHGRRANAYRQPKGASTGAAARAAS